MDGLLELRNIGDRMTFNTKYSQRKQIRGFSLMNQIRENGASDKNDELFRWRLVAVRRVLLPGY
jgi:hypothetical protein